MPTSVFQDCEGSRAFSPLLEADAETWPDVCRDFAGCVVILTQCCIPDEKAQISRRARTFSHVFHTREGKNEENGTVGPGTRPDTGQTFGCR